MRKLMFISIGFTLLFSSCNSVSSKTKSSPSANPVAGAVKVLTNEAFKQKVFNYDISKQWKYEGNLPAIIDFYADWCGPCRVLSPRIEEIAKEYEGKIVVYKVDTDTEPDLAQNMGIQSLPTILFIPVKGQPRASMGALSKETLVKAINEILLVK